MELTSHLRAIWTGRWLILLVAVVATLLAYFASAGQPAVWRATATMQVSIPGADLSSETLANNVTFLQSRYAERINDRELVVAAAEAAAIPVPGVRASSGLTAVESDKFPGVFDVRAQAGSQAAARRYAAAAARQLVSDVEAEQAEDSQASTKALRTELNRLQRDLDEASRGTVLADSLSSRYAAVSNQLVLREAQLQARLRQTSTVLAEDAPFSPRPRRTALLAFLVALVVAGEGVAMLFAYRRHRGQFTGDPEAEVGRLTGLPVVTMFTRGGASGPAGPSEGLLAALLATRRVDARVLVVLGVDDQAAVRPIGARLSGIAVRAGDEVTLVEMTEGGPRGRYAATATQVPDPESGSRRRHGSSGGSRHTVTTGRLTRLHGVAPEEFREGSATTGTLDSIASDLVVISAPPVLPRAIGVEVVVRAGGDALLVMTAATTRRRLDQALRMLRMAGVEPVAVLIEQAPPRFRARRSQSASTQRDRASDEDLGDEPVGSSAPSGPINVHPVPDANVAPDTEGAPDAEANSLSLTNALLGETRETDGPLDGDPAPRGATRR